MTSPWVEAARLRQGLYRFVAGTLLPPSADTPALLRSAASYLTEMGTAGYAYHPYWTTLTDELECLESERLGAEYVRLFASGTDDGLCPPVESYYLGDARGSAAGEIGAAVTRSVKRLGLAHTSTTTPPDHLVSEMEVMSALCGREADAWLADSGPEAIGRIRDEEGFLRAHPMRWVDLLRDRIRTIGAEGLYRSTIEFTHAFVVHDSEFLRAARRYFEGAA